MHQQRSSRPTPLATVLNTRGPRARLGTPGRTSYTEVLEGTVVGGAGHPFDYEATVRMKPVGAKNRPVVTELVLRTVEGGPELGARSLQQAAVGSIIREAIQQLTVSMGEGDDWAGMAGRGGVLDQNDLTSALTRPGRPRRESIPFGDLEVAAAAYRKAQSAKDPAKRTPTTAAVARALNVSTSTARKRVMQARKAGLLPPADGQRRPQLGPED